VVKPQARSHQTRARVIQAAVDCIVDEGYYRASSNRIAERAGVSWGVIKHHFGTREKLLLAVLADRDAKLIATLNSSSIHGDTVAERLKSFISQLFSFYRTPDYLAGLQITLNMGRDPDTRAETAAALSEMSQLVPQRLHEVFSSVALGDPRIAWPEHRPGHRGHHSCRLQRPSRGARRAALGGFGGALQALSRRLAITQ
jgi:AcrR family transcriptional regulator